MAERSSSNDLLHRTSGVDLLREDLDEQHEHDKGDRHQGGDYPQPILTRSFHKVAQAIIVTFQTVRVPVGQVGRFLESLSGEREERKERLDQK